MKLKAIAILFFVLVSLLPAYWLYKYLQQVMRPRESIRKFGFWLLAVYAFIFAYTFLVVFVIKILFPRS